MTGWRGALCLWICAAPALAETVVEVPSGQPLSLYDVVLEAEGAIARFLFLAPGIVLEGEGFGYTDVAPDFAYLCEKIALPALRSNKWEATEIIVSMSSVEVEFGQASPDAVQFFEAYDVEGGACIWRAF